MRGGVDLQMERCMEGHFEEWVDGQIEGLAERWKDGVDGQMEDNWGYNG